MESIDKLVNIVKRLRAPDGCPWDRDQTHESIRGHLAEECAEFLDAVDEKNYPNMREELGDMLFHIMLHAQIASEEGKFDFKDVAEELSEKLIRRHPHVFGDVKAETSGDVIDVWKDVKSKEKKSRPKHENFWRNLPKELSSLRRAYDVSKAIEKADEEKAACMPGANDLSAQMGKKFYELVGECTRKKIEPEGALRDYLKILRNCSDPDLKQ